MLPEAGNSELVVAEGASIKEVLQALDRTGLRVVFAADSGGALVGAISDGDIRRGLLNGVTLDQPASEVMNRNFVSYPHTIDGEEAQSRLSDRISVVPLVDEDGRPTDFVFRKKPNYIPAAEPVLGGNELAYVTDCVETGWISSQGSYVTAFEKAFADYTGAAHVVSVSNGTVALQLALASLGIGPGDEVIVPDLTFAASLNAIIHVGATPVLVDIHPHELNMLPELVEQAITDRTAAIMPVHLYGQMCRMEEIEAIAAKHDLKIIEDAAEALGSRLHGRHSGTWGDAGTFSFFANKLITTGEGGMVSFRDAEVAKRARMLRDHGMDPAKRYWHLEPGFNFRMTNLQAAIGLAQMERIDTLLDAKLSLADRYYGELKELEDIIALPKPIPDSLHSFWNFVILFREGFPDDCVDRVIDFMRTRNIDVRRVFYPMHVMPPYQELRLVGEARNSVTASDSGIALPASPKLTEAEVTDICKALRQAFSMLDVQRLTGGEMSGAS
ncbi:aminotransferase class I/II-fold pyridoxal phosphate-dependent enzyme [Aurantiacibacter sp. D1-12]|uniref:aminotransferase class I/II-fold pyridoxal phosphate-dependent enzyme n=1 Tax=Aurantiacibacter sp. D1-12 TaxID=2993658 RepID=UPI00237C6C74|nr:aminotransferase class I/II-fold pyridoxal phosphate-dependent enzyme [Aurantiacibacter sp. D1-12]MDE1466900.1 aminotransferase class I/II-fold pyridoxal phosphate-dependent enzyme [Aurantiacibacter sp. D1-12]